MDYTEKIINLRHIINTRLLPLIDNDYIYLNLPYHTNIGDLLIWEGTLRFLSQTEHKCLYSTGIYNFKKRNLDKNVIIILHGGGNWGDLWADHHLFRKQIIEMYPENKVIVFPQTVYYQDNRNLKKDIEFYNKYPNVTICTRDNKSFQLMSENFKNNSILLVPDMAFFIDIKYTPQKTSRILFAKRTDKELSLNENIYKKIPNNAEIHDWPTFEVSKRQVFITKNLYRIMSLCRKFDTIFRLDSESFVIDLCWKKILKPYYIRCGINFINNYNEIYSTRLHISILSILMKKKLHIIDNNYGKTTNFIKTWFSADECKQLLE